MSEETDKKEHETEKRRKCFKCKDPLVLEDVCKSNPLLKESYIKQLWKNPYIQFYCCHCYKDMMREKIRYELWNLEHCFNFFVKEPRPKDLNWNEKKFKTIDQFVKGEGCEKVL